jgi:hypothetical protein
MTSSKLFAVTSEFYTTVMFAVFNIHRVFIQVDIFMMCPHTSIYVYIVCLVIAVKFKRYLGISLSLHIVLRSAKILL